MGCIIVNAPHDAPAHAAPQSAVVDQVATETALPTGLPPTNSGPAPDAERLTTVPLPSSPQAQSDAVAIPEQIQQPNDSTTALIAADESVTIVLDNNPAYGAAIGPGTTPIQAANMVAHKAFGLDASVTTNDGRWPVSLTTRQGLAALYSVLITDSTTHHCIAILTLPSGNQIRINPGNHKLLSNANAHYPAFYPWPQQPGQCVAAALTWIKTVTEILLCQAYAITQSLDCVGHYASDYTLKFEITPSISDFSLALIDSSSNELLLDAAEGVSWEGAFNWMLVEEILLITDRSMPSQSAEPSYALVLANHEEFYDDHDSEIPTLWERQSSFSRASLVLKGADTAIDAIRCYQQPTPEHAQALAVDALHLYAMWAGYSVVSAATSAVLVAHTYNEAGFDAAIKQAAMAAAYMALPVLAFSVSPAVGVGFTAAMTCYTAYQVGANGYMLYRENFAAENFGQERFGSDAMLDEQLFVAGDVADGADEWVA